jgi:hypothetical protein
MQVQHYLAEPRHCHYAVAYARALDAPPLLPSIVSILLREIVDAHGCEYNPDLGLVLTRLPSGQMVLWQMIPSLQPLLKRIIQ